MSRASFYSNRRMNAPDVAYQVLRQVDKLFSNSKHAAARKNLSVKVIVFILSNFYLPSSAYTSNLMPIHKL